MKSWKTRWLLLFAVFAMVLGVAGTALASHDDTDTGDSGSRP